MTIPISEPQVLLDGFGYADTHETLNSFLWGPDGWLYGNQGVFNSSRIGKPGAPDRPTHRIECGVWRYHPTRHVFEVFAHGGSNQWGLDYRPARPDLHDPLPQLLGTWSHHACHAGRPLLESGQWGLRAHSSRPRPRQASAQLQNYLLASARYGHGEGGAGETGSRARLRRPLPRRHHDLLWGTTGPTSIAITCSLTILHGHQMNHQINCVRQAATTPSMPVPTCCSAPIRSTSESICSTDPTARFISATGTIPRHCHNPDVEQWDRGNGRMYRMKYDATYRPRTVDYSTASDDQLVEAQLHKNDWDAHTARLVMHERAASGRFSAESMARLRAMAIEHPQADNRLRALWSLHVLGQVDESLVQKLLLDDSEYLRAWTVQLAAESMPPENLAVPLRQLSQRDPSLLVCRYLASAIQRLPADLGWSIASTLAARDDIESDRELVLLLWFGIASRSNDQASVAKTSG